MTPETYNKPVRQTIFIADLKCYMCGGVSGSIESQQPLLGAAPGRVQPVKLLRPGESTPVEVLDWRRLKCARCAGRLFLDETDIVVRRIDEYNWLDERPRRGRPPKRLVEQRQRERELFDSQAA